MKWHWNYLNLAKEISTWSKDPSTKIGAVAVGKHGQILATGYNGFPRKIKDTEKRLNDKEIKYSYTIHGEMNCIYNATLTGVSLHKATLYVHGLPVCSECAKGIAQVGIKRVFACHPINVNVKWEQSNYLSQQIFNEAGIEYNSIISERQ
jgi:dCMP deaminase